MEIKFSSPVKFVLVSASVVILLAGVKAASAILVPVLLSMFIAMACNPLVTRASKYGIPRWLAIILVILGIVILGFMMAGLVGQSMNSFSQNLPQYQEKFAQQFGWVIHQLTLLNIPVDKNQVLSYFNPGVAMGMVTNLLSSVGGVMTNFFLILLTVVFMLFEAESIPRKVHIALDDPAMKIKQIDEFISSVKNYLAIKSVVSLGTGLLAGLWLYILGVDYFVLWAVVAFLLNYIPNIGSIVAAVPAVLLALVQLGPGVAGLTALGYVVINTVMGNVVEPRYMGRGLGLSTLVVFLSLVFWGWLLGTVGMLLSVLLTMLVKVALESSTETRWIAQLLAGQPPSIIPESLADKR